MSDFRALPLRDVAKQGRFGAAQAMPGVYLEILHPVSLVQVLARKAGQKSVADGLKALKGVRVMEAGPGQYYVLAEAKADGALAEALKSKLGAAASVVDQSHGRVVIRMDGPMVRRLLAKGTPVDFAADQFAIGQSANTQMAHVGIHVTRIGANEFLLSVFRGFSESLWEWLCMSAAEFGYQVE